MLQGVECFWFSILPIPLGIIDRIYSIVFYVDVQIPQVSWAHMCRPKGGMEFRYLKAWNLVLLVEVLWRI